MRGARVTIVAAIFAAIWGSGVAEAKDTQEFSIGSWNGFSYSDDSSGNFTDCTAWSTNDSGIQVGVSVLKNWSLQLWLYSKSWNLPLDQSYPVSFWVDRNQQFQGRAVIQGAQSAKIDTDQDQEVFNELERGSQLTFRTSSQDYVFNLNSSRAALDRLLDCVDKYSKTASANPFGGDSGAAQNDAQQNTQQNDNQQNNNPQQNDNQQSGSVVLKSLTMSDKDMTQFLTDVTGAKPSMIKVTAKTDKAGAAFLDFSTPLGDGEFWQENPRDLQDVAEIYLNGYKKDCKQGFEPSESDVQKGQKGAFIVATAACSDSPYQNDGPEFITYVVMQSDNVVSIFNTYVGGNAAKAKTDSLGKLIGNHVRDMTQAQQ
ncbi:MAG TPA: hypothetical protein VGM59_11880 [Dongiaceae bacterium]|jgi:hypothetical protein